MRRQPWLCELELDTDGWTEVAAVLAALRRERPEWRDLGEAELADMICHSSKQRHKMEGGRIRTLYGHSLPGKLARVAAMPPAELYHGTVLDMVAKIRAAGLLLMRRQYVHLLIDQCDCAGNDKVWAADVVPARFIAPDAKRRE